MAEDLDDYRRIFDACPERVEGAAMIFMALPQLGQCSTSISKTPFEQPGPAHARRLSLGRGVIGWGLAGTLWRSGNDLTAQLGVGCQHARGEWPLWISSGCARLWTMTATASRQPNGSAGCRTLPCNRTT